MPTMRRRRQMPRPPESHRSPPPESRSSPDRLRFDLEPRDSAAAEANRNGAAGRAAKARPPPRNTRGRTAAPPPRRRPRRCHRRYALPSASHGVNDSECAQALRRRRDMPRRPAALRSVISTTNAPHSVAVTMKPLPSATITGEYRKACSGQQQLREALGRHEFGLLELDRQHARDRGKEARSPRRARAATAPPERPAP